MSDEPKKIQLNLSRESVATFRKFFDDPKGREYFNSMFQGLREALPGKSAEGDIVFHAFLTGVLIGQELKGSVDLRIPKPDDDDEDPS